MAGRISLPIWYMGRELVRRSSRWINNMCNRMVPGKFDRSNLAHFRFLGLRRGECDAVAIRSAARAMSGLVGECEGSYGVEGEVRRRSEIALAAYRLLDPRRRASFYERVQLCYPVERDDRPSAPADFSSGNAANPNPWVEGSEGVHDAPGDASRDEEPGRCYLMQLPVIERAIQEEMSEATTAQAAAETLSWLEERREVIRSLRELEPRADRSPSAMTWIRSVLGW